MHWSDGLFLASLLGRLSDEVRRLVDDPDLRGEWWQGAPLRFPLPAPIPDEMPEGKWVELRVVDAAEVVEGALGERENGGYDGV